MEETYDKEPHPDYLKGFNEGFTMAKYMPELTEKIGKSLGGSDRGMGFSDGMDQFRVMEKDEQKYPDWLRSDWQKEAGIDKAPEKEKNLGRDDVEIDRE